MLQNPRGGDQSPAPWIPLGLEGRKCAAPSGAPAGADPRQSASPRPEVRRAGRMAAVAGPLGVLGSLCRVLFFLSQCCVLSGAGELQAGGHPSLAGGRGTPGPRRSVREGRAERRGEGWRGAAAHVWRVLAAGPGAPGLAGTLEPASSTTELWSVGPLAPRGVARPGSRTDPDTTLCSLVAHGSKRVRTLPVFHSLVFWAVEL